MSLSDIEKKLYENKPERKLEEYNQVSFDVNRSSVDSAKVGFKNAGDVWKNVDDSGKARKNAVKIGGIVFLTILVIAVLTVGFYFFKKTSFSLERVLISVNGEKEADSGEKLNYEIVINNKNRAKLKSAVLKINYPESFSPEDNPDFVIEGALGGSFKLGDIEGNSEKKILFKGKVYRPKGTIAFIKAELFFDPAGFNGRFTVDSQLDLNIKSSSINLDFTAPQSISSGDSLDYVIVYKNEGKEEFENIQIKIEYPDGFFFSKSEPLASGNNDTWNIGTLSSGQEGRIVVNGRLEGSRGSIKYAKVFIGEFIDGQFLSQNEEKYDTKIEASPLSISQTVNGLKTLNANFGDKLIFEISYKNEGEVGLRDVIITDKIDNAVLDYKTLELLNGGTVDSKNNIITWRASDVPELKNLKPGDSGIIKFEIKVKDTIPINNVQDRNFMISSIAKIDSPDVKTSIQGNKVISGNRMDIKVNSKIFLGIRGFYSDAFTENSGPIPPRVNQETTYVIKWTVNNVSNDMAGVKVETTLPGGVSFTGKIFPENSNLTFNERTNSIVWDIGNLEAGTGILTAAKEVGFQIKLIPAPNQEDGYADLLNKSVLSGKDLYTGENLSYTADVKTTYLPEDKKIGDGGYKVKP